MDDRVRTEALTAAHQLLTRYKDEHLAWQNDTTPIDELVSWLDIEVETFHPNDYPQGTYGYLEPGENLIWLCRGLPESLRRFTLAHELGHFILHRKTEHFQAAQQARGILELSREDPCQQPDVQEELPALNEADLLEEVLGIGMAYNPRSERELAANIFAAELLMPIERVRTLYLNQHIPPNTLAGIFGVSNTAMLNRLAGLLTKQPADTSPAPTDVAGDKSHPAPTKHYDEFQQAAIEAATPALIVAGPGSGKTSTLIGRVEHLITTLHVQPEHILALTFSRKAAQEMAERLEGALQRVSPSVSGGDDASGGDDGSDEDAWQGGMAEAAAQSSATTISLPKVSTFHAFCADVLRAYGNHVGLRAGFTLIDEVEGYFLLRQLTQHMQLYHYRNLKAPAYYFPDFLKAISRAKDELVTPLQYRQLAQRMLEQARDEESELAAKKALEVAAIYALYEEGLQRRGDTDFGGLIMLTVRLLEEFPEVRTEQQQRFQHILVDEFQDINRASGVLLRLLAGEERRVWVVGDANQAIYGFRGASPANIANFQQDYPGAAVLPLSRNYRSRPDIVQVAEAFRWRQLELDAEVEPISNTATRLTSSDTYVTLAEAEDSAAEVAGLIADIQHKHAQGYTYADIAVLCRTRARARKITYALAAAGLPVIEKSGMLAQQHIKDVISLLLLMTDASGMGILRAARQKEHAFTQDDIEALILAAKEQQKPLRMLIADDEAPANISIEGRRSLSRLATILRGLFQTPTNVWSLLAHYLFIETALMRELLREPAGEQRELLDDYAAFLQLARRYDQQQQAQRTMQEQQAEERGESPAPLPTMQEQIRGFLDYLKVMLSLGQDGSNRQQGVEGEASAPIRTGNDAAFTSSAVEQRHCVSSKAQLDGKESSSSAQPVRKEEENAAVIRVMTVHASKGLEFPIVYLPGLIQRNFPLQRHANPVPMPVGMIAGADAEKDIHEVGEACLFYVGVTRARDQLVLSYSKRNGKQKAKPSPYLEALVADLPAERITRVQWQTQGETADIAETTDEEALENFIVSSQPSQSFVEVVKPERLSVSAIEAYQTCPRKYLYSTIYGFSSEESSYQVFWQATQKTLEILQQRLAQAREQGQSSVSAPMRTGNDAITSPPESTLAGEEVIASSSAQPVRKENELLTQDETEEIYTRQWQELGGHTLPFAAIYERHGHEVAWLIREKLLASGDTHWDLRPNFTVEIGGKTISVPVDRVEISTQREKPARFVRTRFARRNEKPAAGMREMLYMRAYREHHAAQNVELHFHNLSTGETFPITLNMKKEQSLYDELDQSIAAMERNEYPPLPDARTCPSCAFFLICPA